MEDLRDGSVNTVRGSLSEKIGELESAVGHLWNILMPYPIQCSDLHEEDSKIEALTARVAMAKDLLVKIIEEAGKL
jgi:hypothetical protein